MHGGFLTAEMIYDASGTAVDYRYVEFNPAYVKLTGISCKRAIGRTLRDIYPTIEPAWSGYEPASSKPRTAGICGPGCATRVLVEVHAWRPEPGRFVFVFTDVTSRVASEQRQLLLAREVDHHAKNALAVVQAAIRLTTAPDVPSFVRAIERRVGASARACWRPPFDGSSAVKSIAYRQQLG